MEIIERVEALLEYCKSNESKQCAVEAQNVVCPWSYRKCGSHWNNPGLERIEINYSEHGECIADTVYREADTTTNWHRSGDWL